MANTPFTNYPVTADRGAIHLVQQPDPGAGAGFIFSLPEVKAEWRYKIISMRFQVVTDATVANRWLGLRIFRHTNPYYLMYVFPQSGSQPASTTRTFEWSPLLRGQYNANGFYYESFPDYDFDTWLRIGQTLQNYQAGDVTSTIWVSLAYNIDQRE